MAAAVPTNWHSNARLAAGVSAKGQLGMMDRVADDAGEVRGPVLTLVLGVLQRATKDLKRAGHVKRIVAREQGKQHLDLLNAVSAVSDCTHCE